MKSIPIKTLRPKRLQLNQKMAKINIEKSTTMVRKTWFVMKFSFIQPKLSEGALEMCSNAWPPLGVLYCAALFPLSQPLLPR